MLRLFRQKKEWLRWVLLFAIIAVGLTTVLLFVDTPSGMRGGIGVQEVARVGNHKITAAEFGRVYRQMLDTYRRIYNLDQQDPEIVRQLGIGQQVLNQLIRQYSAQLAAREMGLMVAPEELVSEISRLFQEGGRFIGAERYRQILMANNMTAKEFEDSMRRDLLAEKFRSIVTDGIVAIESEVRQSFLEQNQEVRVRYVVFDPEKAQMADLTDEQLQAYYDEHREEFREEEQRRVAYVEAAIQPPDVEVTEEQILAELPDVPDNDQVRARHILIRFGDDEEAARQEAQKILEQLRAGADFAEMARQHSADTGSAANGGDLGFFGRGQMVPEFETVAFSQQPGETSNLVRSPFGFHVIQTLEKTESNDAGRRSLAQFNAKLKEALRQSRELAEKVVNEVRAGATLEDASAANSLEVQQSPLFDSFQGIPGLGTDRDFTSSIFAASQGGLLGPEEAGERFIVARVDEIVPSRIPDFSEIRDEIAQRYQSERASVLAQESASEFFRTVQQSGSLLEAARNKGLAVTFSDPFRKGANIDDNLKFSPEVHDQAFNLDVGGVSTPVLVAGKYIVFQVAEKSPVDETRYQEEKAGLAEQLATQKRNEFFSAYVQNVVDELRREEKIVINQALLDELIS